MFRRVCETYLLLDYLVHAQFSDSRELFECDSGRFSKNENLLTCDFTGQIETNYDEVTDSFDAMNLKQELLRGEQT
jgi:hypothetical protein